MECAWIQGAYPLVPDFGFHSCMILIRLRSIATIIRIPHGRTTLPTRPVNPPVSTPYSGGQYTKSLYNPMHVVSTA